MPDSGSTRNTPLPPSVEKAYWRKCIELKKRISEIEESNDNARTRVRRLDRAIRKMRIERAFLLERLAKIQRATVDESDKSTSPPPTPRDRPPRMKRRGDRKSPILDDQSGSPPAPAASQQPQSYQYQPTALSQYQHRSPPTAFYPPPPTVHPQGIPPPPPPQAPAYTAQPVSVTLIHHLPPGTCVMLQADGNPKGPPWTIDDLDPKHRFQPEFDNWTRLEQEASLNHGYTPIDTYGHEILIWEELSGARRFKHAAPGAIPPAGWAVVRNAPMPLPAQVHPPSHSSDGHQHQHDGDRVSLPLEVPRERGARDGEVGPQEGEAEGTPGFATITR